MPLEFNTDEEFIVFIAVAVLHLVLVYIFFREVPGLMVLITYEIDRLHNI